MAQSLATIVTSVITGGSSNHATVSDEANAYATDFVSQGVLGTIGNTNGSGPGTGSFGVAQDTVADMGLTITGTGNTTNSESIAYIKCTPASQALQVLRARMSSNTTGYTVNANSSGVTQYDWVYLQANATNAANPDAAADNVIAIYTSRSSSNSSDNGSPPTYGILLAVVTVINGASSITNANIADKRTQVVFNTGGTASTTGWQSLGDAFTYGANNGSKEFTVTTPNNLTGLLNNGVKMQFTRGVTPPSTCAAFSGTSQYASITSPSGITFTSAFTCEAWVYPTAYQTGGVITRYNGTTGFGLILTSLGQVQIGYYGSGTATTWNSLQSLPLNQWSHIVGVVSSVSSKTLQGIYVNGTSVPTANPNGATTALTQAGPLQVGALNSTSVFAGYVSEARVWSTAQTSANILLRMATNAAGTETNLVADYPLNSVWTDNTTNANTLVASGGASNTQIANPFNAIEYGIVTNVSFSTPTTTLTIYTGNTGTIPNMTLNSPEYSTSNFPIGFPSGIDKWTASTLFLTDYTTAVGSFSTWIDSFLRLTVPTGSWDLRYVATYKPAGTGAASTYGHCLLTSGSPPNGTYSLGLCSEVFSYASVNYAIGTVTNFLPINIAAISNYDLWGEVIAASGTVTFSFLGNTGGATLIEAISGYV